MYFDAAYLVRLYLPDPGWQEVQRLAASQRQRLASLSLGQAETIAAMHRWLREGKLDAAELQARLDQFERDSARGMFHWLALTDAVMDRVRTAYRNAPANLFLRASDALHLACAAENEFREIYSNDARLLAAAPHFGVRGVNIIP